MKEHKIIRNGFTWIPSDKRISQFGGVVPPRKPEIRNPALWLARDGNALYLVNNSKETLEYVIARSGGFQTVDADVLTVASKEQYKYTNVNHGDAVKVEEYDGHYDLDYVLQVYLKVRTSGLGCIEIVSPAKKGGLRETVLLWDSHEADKDVSIKKCKEA